MDVTAVATYMNGQWAEFATALESGDPDRVNEVIDEIKDMDLGERIDLFDLCFDELTEMYAAADDGYVRQQVRADPEEPDDEAQTADSQRPRGVRSGSRRQREARRPERERDE